MTLNKHFALTLNLIFLLSFANAQHKELAVPSYGQKSGLWCWAAGMDMIMEYHLPSTSSRQCMLVEQYLNIAQINSSANCSAYCGDPCTDPPPATYPADCNEDIHYSYSYPYTISGSTMIFSFYDKSYIDILFTENDFFSMEDHVKLTWDQYKFEIDHCRPVLFLYNITGVMDADPTKSTRNFPHAAVGKGYTTMTGLDASTMDNYFMIQDPWDVCDGETYLLHENALTGQAVDAVGGILVDRMNLLLSMVHHISPKANTCDPCDSIPVSRRFIEPEENILLRVIRRYRQDFLATSLGGTFKREILSEYLEKGHFQTKIDYLDYNYFNNSNKKEDLNYTASVIKADVREVTFAKSETPLNSRIRCSEETGACAVETISLARDLAPQAVEIKGDTIWLSNNPYDQTGSEKKAPFSIVRFPPYTFEFYRFSYNNATYYLPTEAYAKAYFYGAKYQHAIVGIPESFFLKGLEKFVLDYDQPKLIEKSPRYQEQVRKILQNGGFLRMDKALNLKKF